MTPNETSFIALTKELLLKQKILSIEIKKDNNQKVYHFNNYAEHNEELFAKNIDLFLQDVTNYLEKKKSMPPIIKYRKQKMRNLTRPWFKQFLKLNPTKEEFDNIFHAVFQSVYFPHLIGFLSQEYSTPDIKTALKLININFKKKDIYNNDLFTQSTLNETINYLSYLSSTYNFTKGTFPPEELMDGLNNFLPLYDKVMINLTNEYGLANCQMNILDFLTKNLPIEKVECFEKYYSKHSVKSENPETSLFKEHTNAITSLTLNHNYIANKFPVLFIKEEVQYMNDIIIEFLLYPENASRLSIEKIMDITKDENNTKLILFSSSEKVVNTNLFFTIYEELVKSYVDHKSTLVSDKPKLTNLENDFNLKMSYHHLNHTLETPSILIKRNKI